VRSGMGNSVAYVNRTTHPPDIHGRGHSGRQILEVSDSDVRASNC
jgi:hypothetical protein